VSLAVEEVSQELELKLQNKILSAFVGGLPSVVPSSIVAEESSVCPKGALMKILLWLMFCLAGLLQIRPADANTVSTCTTLAGAISCTGTLNTPEDVFLETFTLAGSSSIAVQTYGFGGGLNAAGTVIPAGGFDSLVALFSGPATAATVLTDGGGNPIASADNSLLYSQGCPPAGKVTVGTVLAVCGDNTLTAALSAGTYTLLLTDANFVPLAVNPSIVLGPYNLTDTTSNNYGSSSGNGAYTDLTGGVFQTCATLTDCNTDSGNFAVDILGTPTAPSPVPEPTTLGLLSSALAVLICRRAWASKRRAPGGRQ